MEYIYIICPLVALLTCQILKCFVELLETKKFSLTRLTNGSGGMPSSHSAITSSVAMLVGFKEGFSSPIFGIAFVFLVITAYDAMTVRLESGKHATLLNKYYRTTLKEQIGHQPIEVLVGIIFGTFIAYLFSLI